MSGKQELGFIGVGRMGLHMAGRLLEAGYGVTVYDVNETNVARLVQRGAKRAGSPAEVASAACRRRTSSSRWRRMSQPAAR